MKIVDDVKLFEMIWKKALDKSTVNLSILAIKLNFRLWDYRFFINSYILYKGYTNSDERDSDNFEEICAETR